MPDDSTPATPAETGCFAPKALRTAPEERRRIEMFMERVLAAHPTWPWPLIEAEAMRRAEAAGSADGALDSQVVPREQAPDPFGRGPVD